MSGFFDLTDEELAEIDWNRPIFKLWLFHIPSENTLEEANALLEKFCTAGIDADGVPPQSYGSKSFKRIVVVDYHSFINRDEEIFFGKYGRVAVRFATGDSIDYWYGMLMQLLTEAADWKCTFEIAHGSKTMRQAAVLAAANTESAEWIIDGNSCFHMKFIKAEPRIRKRG